MLKLNESQRVRLINVLKDFKVTRDNSLHSVIDDVMSYVERGEINDNYCARYVRDALFFNEETKASHQDLVDVIESKFFA